MSVQATFQSLLVNLGNYKVIRKVNSGAFGDVFEIEHNSDGSRYAAKVNKISLDSDKNVPTLLSREIGILCRVQSPSIIKFRGFSLTDFDNENNITILMDYKENGSLADLIDKEFLSQSPAEYNNTAKQIILCGIAHGMMVLHSRRVIHRDLKPENILLDSNLHPFITDFGISKFLDPDNTKSQSRAGCGTTPYIAPEVVTSPHYGPKADVFSFGILMYEVITGERAYRSLINQSNMTPFKFLTLVETGTRPEFHTPIKPALKKLIEQCWSGDPNARPSFRTIFNKLSLSLDDDEALSNALNDLLSESAEANNPEEEEFDYFMYCLPDVDHEQLLDFVEEITSTDSDRILKIQQERIDQLTQLVQSHQDEIDTLKKQLKESNLMATAGIEQPKLLLDGLTIQQIAEKVKTENITHLILPSTLTSISNQAFQWSKSLVEVTIPSSVTTIEDYAFFNCISLTKVVIPFSVTTIGSCAFGSCGALTQITIPSSVTSIGMQAFSRCTSLTEITIPSSVRSIGSQAFSRCTSLANITISSSATVIGKSAFYRCPALPSSVRDDLQQKYGEEIFD